MNTYTGVTKVEEGSLLISNAAALGTTAGNTVGSSGAVLYKIGGSDLNIAEAINISGAGINGVGAIRFGSVAARRALCQES
jgi:hypothetical protein